MKLEVNVSKTRFVFAVGAVLVLAGIIGVIAFGGSTLSVVGHSSGEIDFSDGLRVFNPSPDDPVSDAGTDIAKVTVAIPPNARSTVGYYLDSGHCEYSNLLYSSFTNFWY